MQSLNLSGETKKSDGSLKSLFWPTVENAWDVDYLGQQGFWICFVVAIVNLVFATLEIPNSTEPFLTLILGIPVSFIYFVGGMGVRHASWPAALTVFGLYVLDHLSAGRLGIVPIIFGGVLLSNVRATILASKWKQATEDEDRPTRFNETLVDKLADQLPPRAWPALKYPFYFFAIAMLLLLLLATAQHLFGLG
jgi:hypothetical protein